MVSFNNIIGHKDIVKHLQNAIKTEKISHSYMKLPIQNRRRNRAMSEV